MTVSQAELMDAIDSCRRKVRRKYRGQPYCEDLEQEAAIGVLRAAEDFDPARGASFKTYAHWWAWARSGRLSERERAAERGWTHSEITGKARRPEMWRTQVSMDARDGRALAGSGLKRAGVNEVGEAPMQSSVHASVPPEQEGAADVVRIRRALAAAAERISRRSSEMSGRIAWRLAALMAQEGEADGSQVAREIGCTRQNVNRVRALLLAEARSILGVWES